VRLLKTVSNLGILSMSPYQAIDFLVLNAIANDYEDFQTISADVRRWAAEDDLTITPGLMLESLERLGDSS